MKEDKRIPCSYKVKTSVYKKAMRRALKEKAKLARVIETIVTRYAEDGMFAFNEHNSLMDIWDNKSAKN